MTDKVKIVVFVPKAESEKLLKIIGEAGAGVVGNYSFCSFSLNGVGRFKPNNKSKPYIGKVGELDTVHEERIEVECEKSKAPRIVKIIKNNHPYEEVVVDVYQLLQFD